MNTVATPEKLAKTAKEIKESGATYTPKELADFVAQQIVNEAQSQLKKSKLRILDPATGDGELLISLLAKLKDIGIVDVEVHGFDIDDDALKLSRTRIKKAYPKAQIYFSHSNFLNFIVASANPHDKGSLFEETAPDFDLIIANPPYVRTQVMGAEQAQLLAKQFGLTGRVDLYFAFIIGMAMVLNPRGTCGVIVSNRFMTTRSGRSVRESIRDKFSIKRVWDLGDTKLFEAAVLPAVLLLGNDQKRSTDPIDFVSIYETTEASTTPAKSNVIEALSSEGVVALADGRNFAVKKGKLDLQTPLDSVWRVSNDESNRWLATVLDNTHLSFGDIGKIRVGVKTCADNVFIRDDWHTMEPDTTPELLRNLTTHHIGCQYRSVEVDKPKAIVYPHEVYEGKRRAIDLDRYPNTRKYLSTHREQLESRKYVIAGGRQWYEIWVPQNPSSWDRPKLVFRDIAERPTFWLDFQGSIINGDCYWMILNDGLDEDLLWLAASVANSTFIESFYDHSFNNKLYAGRRRYITQYVERFPLPNPEKKSSKAIVSLAKKAFKSIDKTQRQQYIGRINDLVWSAFGVSCEESSR